MRSRILLSIATLTVLAFCVSCAGDETKAVDDAELGLTKTSVFSTPDPVVAASLGKDPGENESLGAYFSGSPPMVSHQIADFLPIKLDENMCLDCHLLPDEIGTETEAGDPTPIPASHYTDLRRNPGEVTQELIGARFTCTQCHVPLTDATPLVANTYAQ